MHALTHIEATALPYLPDPRSVQSGDTVYEATHVVSENIYPHRLRVANTGGRSLMCLTSALDLGDCALGYVQYGFDVEIDSGVIAEYQLVKTTLAGHGRVICGPESVITQPRSIVMTSLTEVSRVMMSAECRHLTARVCRKAVEQRIVEKLGRNLRAPLKFDMEIPSD